MGKPKRILRGVGIGAGVLAVLFLVFLIVFRLQTISVTGNSRYSRQDILDMLEYDSDSYTNTLIFFLMNRNPDVSDITYIEEMSLKIRGVSAVLIEVTEKTVIGYVECDGAYVYIDAQGTILEVSDDLQEDVMRIEGVQITDPEEGQVLSEEEISVLPVILELTGYLSLYDVSADQITISEDDTYNLQIGEITVALGYANDLEDQISELVNILPQLEGYAGILHMENYDASSDSIIFTKE